MEKYIDAIIYVRVPEWQIGERVALFFKDTMQVSGVCRRKPTADVVERKRGKWEERKVIEDGKVIEEWQSARCSVCGKYHTTPYLYYFYDFAYCPNCGARMEEKDG